MPLAPLRRWILPPDVPDAAPDGVAPIVARILAGRGLAVAAIPEFLAGRMRTEGPPMLDLDRALETLEGAVARGERIAVYGDYDVDGIAGTAILSRAFRALGVPVETYIPSRYEEGYGLNADALERLAASGVKVVLTVDCGVTAVREAAVARSLGLELVITDHHHPPAVLPDAAAVVNPRRAGDPSPDRELAGAGVALVLAEALLGPARFAGVAEALLQLAALATVADVVPLVGRNRGITRAGLEAMSRTPLAGVRALAERAGLRPGRVTAGDVGYVLAPRLNAAGRISDAEEALRLLLTDDAGEAAAVAEALEARNLERQALTRTVVAGARAQALERPDAWATVVADAGWPAGIVGLAASRLVEELGRPAAVIALDAGVGKGSCRSIGAVHIAEALDACDDLLLKHGGHAMAAGFSVEEARIPELIARLDAVVAERLAGARPVPSLVVDAALAPEALTARLALELATLEPCGAGNPRPRLLLRDVRVHGVRQVGAERDHLRCKMTVGRFTFDAMAFRRGERADALAAEERVDAVVAVGNGLRGMVELELHDFGSVGSADAFAAEAGRVRVA